ncbi:aspartic proteinase pcs1 [Phtheirospermum japonicum]|uniref:Aspartic proteinase pcs1 n=1 Tax=Phtheirospermum japonicum TaxID=374723 RepID=A0A830BYK0_9LAMI|nr:aspartic proteinase pcs1 [Phtheirospermum japonicum]
MHLDEPMQYTGLIPRVDKQYYGVNITGVYVNGTRVDMDTKALEFDSKGNGGAFVDSGAWGTYLVDAAYRPIISAINVTFAGFETISTGPFNVCYNTTGRAGEFPKAPKLEFVFAGDARFAPHPESYVLRIDETMTCLALINATAQRIKYSTIGAMLQQRFAWELDLEKNILGFASSNCADTA